MNTEEMEKVEEVREEIPPPNYEKLMLWSFISIFALIAVLSVYNHYFPDENRPPRPVPTRAVQPKASEENVKDTDDKSETAAPSDDASKQ